MPCSAHARRVKITVQNFPSSLKAMQTAIQTTIQTTMQRGFPEVEFETRTAVLQDMMAARRLDGVVLTTEPNVRYFSGFFTQFWQSPTRPWFCLLYTSPSPRDATLSRMPSSA